MGLDSVEIVIGWEEALGVTITDAEATVTRTPRMAIDLLTAKLGAIDDHRGACLTLRAFNRVRRGLVSGDYGEWTALSTLLDSFSSASAAQKPAIYTQITDVVDMDNYIDYLIANSYGQPSDWPGNNFRAAKRRNTVGAKWKFFVWDAEWTLRQGEQQGSPLWSLSGDEPTHIHTALQNYQSYKDAFSVRMNRAFKITAGDAGSGSLLPASVQTRFQAAMGRFDDLIFSESARWGYMAKSVPYTKSDPAYLPGQTQGDWDRSTGYILNTWLPQRDSVFRNAFQNDGLYTPIP